MRHVSSDQKQPDELCDDKRRPQDCGRNRYLAGKKTKQRCKPQPKPHKVVLHPGPGSSAPSCITALSEMSAPSSSSAVRGKAKVLISILAQGRSHCQSDANIVKNG